MPNVSGVLSTRANVGEHAESVCTSRRCSDMLGEVECRTSVHASVRVIEHRVPKNASARAPNVAERAMRARACELVSDGTERSDYPMQTWWSSGTIPDGQLCLKDADEC